MCSFCLPFSFKRQTEGGKKDVDRGVDGGDEDLNEGEKKSVSGGIGMEVLKGA